VGAAERCGGDSILPAQSLSRAAGGGHLRWRVAAGCSAYGGGDGKLRDTLLVHLVL